MTTDDLAAFYDVVNGDAELVTVQGVPDVPALYSSASEVVLAEAVVLAPTLRVQGTVAAADGGTCLVRGLTYRIRQVMDLPPDGRERLLVLART